MMKSTLAKRKKIHRKLRNLYVPTCTQVTL